MKRWKDPFPQTPKGFHNRVEQTLSGLEDTNMKRNYCNRRLRIALIAALIAILMTTVVSVAVVLGSARFKQALTDGGADEVAALVQEVHVPGMGDEADGFTLTVDEIIWEDDQLYFTYTANVPEDGKSYLLALYTPLLNGEPMAFNPTGWEGSAFFDDVAQTVIPMGGAKPATCGQLLTFKVDPELRQKTANALCLRADFFSTDIDFTGDVSGFESQFKGAVPTVRLTFDDTESMGEYAERLSLPAAETAALREIADAAGSDGILTPEELAGAAHIETAASREVRMALNASELAQTVYDGVEEAEFEITGCKLTIEDFRMTHLGALFKLRVTAPSNMTEEQGKRLAWDIAAMEKGDGDYCWNLFRPDGSALALDEGWEGGAGYQPLADGTPSFVVSYEIDGIIPLEGLEKVVLMPCRVEYDEEDNASYDYLIDWAIELKPTLSRTESAAPVQTLSPEEQTAFDRAMDGEIATRLTRRVAAANWREGSPSVAVYATKGGRFYHADSDCSGMEGAAPWAIEDAVKAGKQPCPTCIGGVNAPDEVDIFTITGDS